MRSKSAGAAKASAILSLLLLGSCVLVLDYGDYKQATGGQAGPGGQTGAGGGQSCEAGSQSACYSGPPATADVGACKGGTRTCDSDGFGFGDCMSEVTPTPRGASHIPGRNGHPGRLVLHQQLAPMEPRFRRPGRGPRAQRRAQQRGYRGGHGSLPEGAPR